MELLKSEVINQLSPSRSPRWYNGRNLNGRCTVTTTLPEICLPAQLFATNLSPNADTVHKTELYQRNAECLVARSLRRYLSSNAKPQNCDLLMNVVPFFCPAADRLLLRLSVHRYLPYHLTALTDSQSEDVIMTLHNNVMILSLDRPLSILMAHAS